MDLRKRTNLGGPNRVYPDPTRTPTPPLRSASLHQEFHTRLTVAVVVDLGVTFTSKNMARSGGLSL